MPTLKSYETNGHTPRPAPSELTAGSASVGQQSALANRLNEKLRAKQPSETTSKPEPTTIYTAAEIMAMELPEPRCVIHSLFTEGLNLLVGPSKIGKSWLLLQSGIAVATGGFALGSLPVIQGDVLYLALEDNHRRLKDRLTKQLCGKPAPTNLEIATQWPRLDEGGLEKLYEWIEGVENPCLAMVDVLAKARSVKSGKGRDQYSLDYEAIGQLKEFADEHNISLAVSHHPRKAEGDDALDAVNGTNGIAGAADTIIFLKRERGELDASLYITGRDIDEHDIPLEWDKTNCSWIKTDGEARELRMSEARRVVLECVRQHEPITPKDVAEKLNKKREAVRKMLATMAKGGEVKANSSGQYVVVTPVTG